jgi:MFS family permease
MLGGSRIGRVYPGWWLSIHACLSLGMVAGATFWGFGLFVEPLEHEFGWSRSITSGAISVTLLASGLASPIVGRLVDRFKPRVILAIGSAVTVVCYLALATIGELWQLLALLAVLAFFRTWIFYIPITTLITRWFPQRRATAMGIATSGFGMGGLLFLPLMALCITSVGWRETFLLTAALVVVINLPFLLFFRNDPSPKSLERLPGGALSAVSTDEGIFESETLNSVFRSPAFWLMSAGFALFFCAQWAFLFHAVPFMEDRGISARDAAVILSAAAGLGVALRLGSGFFVDRIQRYELLAVFVLLVMAGALIVAASGTAHGQLVEFVVLWGIGSGIGPLLEPMLVSRLFGRRHYASVYGAVDGVDTIVAIIGPWAGGLIFDASGSYVPVLLFYSGLFVAGAVAFVGVIAAVLARVRAAQSMEPLAKAA